MAALNPLSEDQLDPPSANPAEAAGGFVVAHRVKRPPERRPGQHDRGERRGDDEDHAGDRNPRDITGELPYPPDPLAGVIASPDGRTLYYGARQTQANIWIVKRASHTASDSVRR